MITTYHLKYFMDTATAYQSFTDSLCELQTWMLQVRTSAQFDLAMRPAGSLFSGAVFGHHEVAIKKQFDGPIKGYVLVKLNTKIDTYTTKHPTDQTHIRPDICIPGNELVTWSNRRDNKILLRMSGYGDSDMHAREHKQDVVLERILDIVKIVSDEVRGFDMSYIELFSVDPRVSELVAGFLSNDEEGVKEAWSLMPDDKRRRVLEFMHELQEKEGDSNTMELSFLYDLQSVLFS
jgi:hypothetical protein